MDQGKQDDIREEIFHGSRAAKVGKVGVLKDSVGATLIIRFTVAESPTLVAQHAMSVYLANAQL